MECVILFRYRRGNVDFIHEDEHEDRIAVFKNQDDAIACARENRLLQALPYRIVELDGL
jgi:hypothetical protein